MKNLYLLLFTLLIVFNSCTDSSNQGLHDTISGVKQNNIVDARLEYWNINLEKLGSKIIISGSTSSKDAFEELKEKISNQFSKANFGVELLPSSSLNSKVWGIVNLSVCNIRRTGTHSSELVSQALFGTPVKVFKKEGGWFLIQTPDGYFGWVDKMGIALKSESDLAQFQKFKKVLYNRQSGFSYQQKNEKYLVYSDLVLANLLFVTDSVSEFYEIIFPDNRVAFVKKEECISLNNWNKETFEIYDVVKSAKNFLGIPYLWGGASSKMTDCSGFTKTVFYLNGIILQRDASQQTLYGRLVDTKTDYEKLQVGDLLFFGRASSGSRKENVTHVGLYIGDSEFIHASGKVRINSLDKDHGNYIQNYEESFIRARRIKESVIGGGVEWVTENEFYKVIL